MLENNVGLTSLNQKLNKYLLNPIAESIEQEKDMIVNQARKLTETKTVKFSYPKNGLYGLL
jgi:hypothetical protein